MFAMERKMFWVLVTMLLVLHGIVWTVKLTPSVADIYEYESVTFTCVYAEYTLVSIWNRYTKDDNFSATVFNQDDSCILAGWNSSATCPNSSAVIISISNVSRKEHGLRLNCENDKGIKSNISTIYVRVPITSVDIINSSNSDVVCSIADFKKELICETSKGRPAANITWTKHIDNIKVGVCNHSLTDNNFKSITSNNRLEKVSSCLEIIPTKDDNGTRIFCEATNGKAVQKSKEMTLYVQYPPMKPILYIDNRMLNRSIQCIFGNNVSIFCSSESEPHPTYVWQTGITGRIENQHYDLFNISIDTTLQCTAINNMTLANGRSIVGNSSSIIEIEVLTPATTPYLHVVLSSMNVSANATVFVIQNDSITISCQSDGNPKPKCTWVGYNESLMKISSARQDTNITCIASNQMRETIGDIRTSSANTTISILVCYPPENLSLYFIDHSNVEGNGVEIENNMLNIVENTTFTVICNASGFPIPDCTWDLFGENITANLTISSIQRDQKGQFTCFAENTIRRSIPEHQERKINSAILDINILYPSRVNSFFADGYENLTVVEVTENSNLTFHCSVKSNPGSWIVVLFESQELRHIASANHLTHTHRVNSCLDDGSYKCSAHNCFNRWHSSKELTLKVSCTPQVSPLLDLVSNLTSAIDETVILSFTALANPKPIFDWFKYHDDVWEKQINGINIFINTSDLASSLTIRKVTNNEFGKYKLRIRNIVGSFEQMYYLNGKGIVNTPNKTNNIIGIVTGIASGTVVVVLLFLLFVKLWTKRRSNRDKNTSMYTRDQSSGNQMETTISLGTRIQQSSTTEQSEVNDRFDDLQEIDDVPAIMYERTEYYNSIDKIESIDKIKVSELFQYVTGREEEDFSIEFQMIPTNLNLSYDVAMKPENVALNRYMGIFPYDHSRVMISTIPDFFMNACYIDGFEKEKEYIASLGPTKKTTNSFITFWQMVWYERSDVIVMLTNLHEKSGMKCEQYWSDEGERASYGDFCVTSLRSERYADYTVRTFELSRKKEKRSLTHLHYTAWPDKTVPEDVTSLIEFRQRMIKTPRLFDGPVIVHCSAGIGRTGTLIAIDRLIKEGEKTFELNVFECVQNMREQRVKMVQTLEQYMYIYNALVTALTFDSETIILSDLPNYVERTNNNTYSRQFQQLKQSADKIAKSEQDAYERNGNRVNENRQKADKPGDMFRQQLHLKQKHKDGDDYINAVFVNSFLKADIFIMAQTPLPTTIDDFVCLLYQENCACVVSLDDLNDSEKLIGTYVPEGKHKLKIGLFEISSSVVGTNRQFILKKLRITCNDKGGETSVLHFQYMNWKPERHTPECAEDFVQFVCEVQKYASKQDIETSHVLVHCLKASERSGLFCALAIIFEKLKFERQVSVSNTVRHLRTRRRTAITSMEQLKFCYQAASIYAGLEKHS